MEFYLFHESILLKNPMDFKMPSEAVEYNQQTQQNFLVFPRFNFCFAVPGSKYLSCKYYQNS